MMSMIPGVQNSPPFVRIPPLVHRHGHRIIDLSVVVDYIYST